MSHDQFVTHIYSRLSTIISSDPFFSDIHCHPSKISFPKFNQFQQGSLILISIRRFDDSLIQIHVSEDARVFQLKKVLKENFSDKKINWKIIWKKYILSTNDQQQLMNNNRRIKDYGVSNNCELFFVRRRRLK
ncbi:hypothetical protein I4U23_003444 [Adineta vaga]|nr:hypothetical protein I4U23_003444 [Adineta vaga]